MARPTIPAENPIFELTSPDSMIQRPPEFSGELPGVAPEHVDAMTQQHGWFRQQLMLIEAALWGRWPYWLATVLNRRLGPTPEWAIPKLFFGPIQGSGMINHPDETIRQMVGTRDSAKKQVFGVFGQALRSGGSIADLFRWWLYAFGSPTVTERPRLTDEAKVAMYSGLNLGWLLGHPGDWAAALCLEFLGPNKLGGWFPTPIHVATLMVKMSFIHEQTDYRTARVNDPCVGTGVMLLCASNYSLNLSGQDINQTMCLACEFNAWLFVPWLVYGKQVVRELRDEPAPEGDDEDECPSGSEKQGQESKRDWRSPEITLRPDEQQGSLFETG